jgi:hypothetical protein
MTPQLEPTYLRYIYDGLIKGSIHPENSAELPEGLIGLYEEAFDERQPVQKRQQLLERFAIWALLYEGLTGGGGGGAKFILPLEPGGGGGGNTGGATGGSSSRGIGGTGGDPGSAGANGLPNSGDGGCGGGGGDPCCNNTSGCTADNICNTTKFGGAPGLGGSGIVYIRYLFEQ